MLELRSERVARARLERKFRRVDPKFEQCRLSLGYPTYRSALKFRAFCLLDVDSLILRQLLQNLKANDLERSKLSRVRRIQVHCLSRTQVNHAKSAVVILEQLLTSTNARALFDRTHADGYFAGRIDPVL